MRELFSSNILGSSSVRCYLSRDCDAISRELIHYTLNCHCTKLPNTTLDTCLFKTVDRGPGEGSTSSEKRILTGRLQRPASETGILNVNEASQEGREREGDATCEFFSIIFFFCLLEAQRKHLCVLMS